MQSGSGVVTSVASDKALRNVPIEAQGDPEMGLPHMLRAREANRDDPSVLSALQAFWDSCMLDARRSHRTRQQEFMARGGYTDRAVHHQRILVHLRLARRLRRAPKRRRRPRVLPMAPPCEMACR